MEKLVQRVRSAMNLLLIWALVLFWVATIEPVDIHRLCLNLQSNWIDLSSAAINGGKVAEPSLARSTGPPLSAGQAALLQRFRSQCNCLSTIKYASMSSFLHREATEPAIEYAAACRRALQTAQQGAQDKHPGLSSEQTSKLIVTIERQLAELDWHIERLDLGPTATLMDVAREARPRITIPGSGLTIPMAGGVALSIVGFTCVYFYLVSLLRALRDALDDEDISTARDWLFFHPGWLGPLLGLVWLSLPLVALQAAGTTVFSVQAVSSVSKLAMYTALLLPFAWLWCVIAAIRTRRKLGQQSRSEVSASRPEVSGSDHDAWARETAERRLKTYTDAGISLESYRRAA